MRRTSDGWEITQRALNSAVLLFALCSILLSAGVSWGVTKTKLDGTVTMPVFSAHETEFLLHTRDEQAALSTLQTQNAQMLDEIRTISRRVRDIYCADKPAGCS